MKCRELQFGDWCCSGHGLPMQITNVGDDYAYATWEGNEGDPWEFDDKDDQPKPIPLTAEILEKNSIKKRGDNDEYAVFRWEGMKQWYVTLEDFKPQYDFWFITSSDRDLNVSGQIRYVHQLQQALRLAGLTDMANNFKI